MTAQRRPKPTTITRIGVTNAIRYLSAATSFAARAEGCHDATGHFGANNIPEVIRCVDQAAHQLGLMLINPGIRDIRVTDLEAGLAAAHAREAALRGLLFELHAIVKGECPSLLDGDSGGNAVLDLDICAALEVKP